MKILKSIPEGEVFRWQGAPDLEMVPKQQITRSDIVMLVMVTAIFGFVLVTMSGQLTGSWMGYGIWIGIAATLGAMLWFFNGGRHRLNMIRLGKSSYALGARHMYVMIKRPGKNPKIWQFIVTAEERITFNGQEPGMVALFPPKVDRETMRTSYYSRFEHIHDAAKVYAMLLEMQTESAARVAAQE